MRRNQGNGLVLLLGVMAVLLVAASATAGYLYFQNQKFQAKPISAPTITPSPTPPDETAGWKIYSTPQYSLKYPPGWSVSDRTQQVKGPGGKAAGNIESLVFLGNASDKGITLSVENGTYNQYLRFLRGLPGGINMDRKESDTTVAGYPGVRITGRTVLGGGAMTGARPIDQPHLIIAINKSGKPYVFDADPSLAVSLDQILSTFKFD